MNTRQKKKQYKKRYGHNPPKGADGRYLFHVTYGLDMEAEKNRNGRLIAERIEVLEKTKLTLEDVEHISKALYEAGATAAQMIADFAAAISQGFSGIAETLRGQIEEQEEPPAVVARSLAERRRTCSRKKWKASKR